MLTKPISSSSWAHSLSAVMCGHATELWPVEYEQKGCVAPSGLAGKTPASSLSSFLSLPAGFVPELQWGKQLYPLEASMMKKCPNSLLSKMAAMCSLSI